MTAENRRRAIAEELRLGASALAAARLLRDAGLHGDALGRLYYALFHHIAAALLTQGVEARRHAALPGLIGRHLVPLGVVGHHDVAVVGRAMSHRQLADYERDWHADPETLDELFLEVEPLLDRLREWLAREGWVGVD